MQEQREITHTRPYGSHKPPIEGMDPNPCGGFNPACPANPNTPEQITELMALHEGDKDEGFSAERPYPDFSDYPERLCGQRKPHCPLVEQ